MAQDKDQKTLNVPPLRFTGFTGDWKKTTLGEIGKTFNGLTGKNSNDFGQGSPYITYKSIFDNSKVDISRVEYVTITDNERIKSAQNVVRLGDIFFTTSSETPTEVGMTSVLLDGIEDCYLNSFCFGYRLSNKEETLPEYFRFYLRASVIRNKLSILAQGSTRFNISKNEVMRMGINLPNSSEQEKIAALLSCIDERITTQNKIIEKLESLIKGIAHKVAGMGKPNIRMSECLECTSSTLQESDVSEVGTYPVYGANGIVGYLNGYNTSDEAIYIIKYGSGVGSVSYVKGKCSATGTLNILTAKQDYSLQFLYYILKVFSFVPYKTGMAIPHIYFKDYGKAHIFCPSYSEQLKYAKFLSTIDDKLLVEQNILINLSLQKQYLLLQMFI